MVIHSMPFNIMGIKQFDFVFLIINLLIEIADSQIFLFFRHTS